MPWGKDVGRQGSPSTGRRQHSWGLENHCAPGLGSMRQGPECQLQFLGVDFVVGAESCPSLLLHGPCFLVSYLCRTVGEWAGS